MECLDVQVADWPELDGVLAEQIILFVMSDCTGSEFAACDVNWMYESSRVFFPGVISGMKSLLVSHSFSLSNSLYEVSCNKDSNGEPKSSESSLSPSTGPYEVDLATTTNGNVTTKEV